MIKTEKPLKILVVDDDRLVHTAMAGNLEGHRVDCVFDAAAGSRRLETGRYDLCFLDLELVPGDEGKSGLNLIAKAVANGIYTVVVSGHDGESQVAEAYELGAKDFYAKGTGLRSHLKRVLAKFAARDTNRKEDIFKERFITEDSDLKFAVTGILDLAPSEMPLLLLGPSGSGKTSLARLIHDCSGRSGSFVAVNCGSVHEGLLEAELFGVRAGSFTDQEEGRKGMLAAADKGTLFLDEIGCMSLNMQSKLLKAIEEREYYPVGSEIAERSDFRLISATLAQPNNLVDSGRLRADLFERIRGASVVLKSLAARKCDILPLVQYLTRGGRRLSFSEEAKFELLNYSWPGNVRELKRIVDLLVAGEHGRVDASVLKPLLSRADISDYDPILSDDFYRLAKESGLDAAVARLRDQAIGRMLRECGGVKRRALDQLKISSRTLYTTLNRSDSQVELE